MHKHPCLQACNCGGQTVRITVVHTGTVISCSHRSYCMDSHGSIIMYHSSEGPIASTLYVCLPNVALERVDSVHFTVAGTRRLDRTEDHVGITVAAVTQV